MNDSKPPDDNVISFDSFKKKDGRKGNSRKSPPRKKNQSIHSADSDHVFKVEPGRVIECKVYSTSDGGYLVKVGENLTAFLSSDNEYDFGMIIKAQIICEKDGYLLLSDQVDDESSSGNVLELLGSNSEDPENIFQLKPIDDENVDNNSPSRGQCIPFKPSNKPSQDHEDEPS